MSTTNFGTNNSQRIKRWSKAVLRQAIQTSRFNKFLQDEHRRPIVSLETDNGWDTFELSVGDYIYWHVIIDNAGPIDSITELGHLVVNKMKAENDVADSFRESETFIVPTAWITKVDKLWV